MPDETPGIGAQTETGTLTRGELNELYTLGERMCNDMLTAARLMADEPLKRPASAWVSIAAEYADALSALENGAL